MQKKRKMLFNHRIFQKISAIICLTFFLLLQAVLPAFGWKAKTHVYSANLIIKELEDNNGWVDIPPYGRFKVSGEFADAIANFPDYYRAGAIGPDGFPDLYIGQAFIHPKDKTTSNDWLTHLWNSLPHQSNDRQRKLSFVLGFLTHAAGDLFGHNYVNSWAQGPWPDMDELSSTDGQKNVIRHLTVESYIDKKIPGKFQPSKYGENPYLKIFAPNAFIREKLVLDENNPGKMNAIYGDKKPKHIQLFLDLRKEVIKQFELWEDDYFIEWRNDIDTGIQAWFNMSSDISYYLLIGETHNAKDLIDSWITEHFDKMTGVGIPDWIEIDIDVIDEIKKYAYDGILTEAIGLDTETLGDIANNPEKWLKKSEYFASSAEARINADIGNFDSEQPGINDHTFAPFHDTLVMGKLILLESHQLNELLRRAGLSDQIYDSEENAILGFVNSLDKSFHKQNLEAFKLYNDFFRRQRVFHNIFKSIKKDNTPSLPAANSNVQMINTSQLEMTAKFKYPSDTALPINRKSFNVFWWDNTLTWQPASRQAYDLNGPDGNLYHYVDISSGTTPSNLAFSEAVFGLVDKPLELIQPESNSDITITNPPIKSVVSNHTDLSLNTVRPIIQANSIVLKIGDPNMTVGEANMEIDPGKGTAPVIVDGSTFLPISAVIQKIGGDIEWDGKERKVTIRQEGNIVQLWINRKTAVVNGIIKQLNAAPFLSKTGRTMLPLRFVSENLGCDVRWDGSSRTVNISFKTLPNINEAFGQDALTIYDIAKPNQPNGIPKQAASLKDYSIIIKYKPSNSNPDIFKKKHLVWWNGPEQKWEKVSNQKVVGINGVSPYFVIEVGADTTPSLKDFSKAVFGTVWEPIQFDFKPVVKVKAGSNAWETRGTGHFIVTRTGSTANPLTVNYTVGGTAVPGVDYAALPGSVTIPAGQSMVKIPVIGKADKVGDPGEEVKVTLNYKLGSMWDNPYLVYPYNNNASISIWDEVFDISDETQPPQSPGPTLPGTINPQLPSVNPNPVNLTQ